MYCHSVPRGGFSMPMRKKTIRRTNLSRLLLPLMIGAAVYVLLCLLLAHGVQSEWLPTEIISAASMAALTVSAIVIALLSRGGREGMIFGCAYAALYLVWRLITCSSRPLSLSTAVGVCICAVCPWLFSCIFHKSQLRNTNRNHRKIRR